MAGWFYHTPNKARKAEPIMVPPASQIPGLSAVAPEPEDQESVRGWIRDTDSDYVRLAKTGGRKDLLAYRDPKPCPDKPKNYPRVDWFYLEDIAAKEAEKNGSKEPQEPYQFALPEYMVHQGHQGQLEEQGYNPRRAAFHFDNMSAFQREGDSVTDKTVKIPEYESAARTKQKKPVKYAAQPKPEKGRAPSQQIDTANKYHPIFQDNSAGEKPHMSKILSYAYAKEWEVRKNRWEEEQRQLEAKDKNRKPEKPATEYQSEMSKRTKLNSPRNSKANGDHRVRPHDVRHGAQDLPKEEPFKLSRFKNVPARTITHRTEPMASVST